MVTVLPMSKGSLHFGHGACGGARRPPRRSDAASFLQLNHRWMHERWYTWPQFTSACGRERGWRVVGTTSVRRGVKHSPGSACRKSRLGGLARRANAIGAHLRREGERAARAQRTWRISNLACRRCAGNVPRSSPPWTPCTRSIATSSPTRREVATTREPRRQATPGARPRVTPSFVRLLGRASREKTTSARQLKSNA